MNSDCGEWSIAVKKIAALSKDLKEELLNLGCKVAEENVFLHIHLFIPVNNYGKVEELLESNGFSLQEKHPEYCTFNDDSFEIFEKRVPIIEARENDTMKKLLDYGILMSGGAGVPHIHIQIADNMHSEVEAKLNENGYYKKR
ncbi:MAG: hypothetical protein HQK84_08360 [Nitrospinae bacterium]|nr:hypothetical protein [Nitrospinota bacterium]